MLAAIRSVRARKPPKLIVAIGVAPAQALPRIEAEADEVVCLYAPDDFSAVGQFFEDFSEVNDEMVVSALSRREPGVPAPPSPRTGGQLETSGKR